MSLGVYGDTQVGTGGIATTVTYEFPTNIKVWDAISERELVSGVPYPFEDSTGPHFVLSDPNFTFANIVVEPILPSEAVNDVELKVTVAPGRSPATILQDTIRFTIVDLSADLPGDIDVATGELFVSVPLIGDNAAFNNEPIRLNLIKDGDAIIATQDAVVTNGSATAVFDIPPTAGTELSVETLFRGQLNRSTENRLTADSPGAIELVTSKESVVADGTDVIALTATIRDRFGNLLEDGTPASWSIRFGGGVYTNGGTTGATQTTNGQAMITLRAPDVPGAQRVVVTSGEAETSLEIVAEAAEFTLSGVATLNLATGQSGTVTVLNANVADGTPVFWTLSNGQIVGGQDGGRVFAGTIQNGTASINISASGPWARYGQAVVTATIGGRLHHHEVDFVTSGLFTVEIEQFVLAGDKTTNGVKTIVYAEPNPMWQGQPAWGFNPPPQNWPTPRNIGYYAETPVIIHGTPFQTYYVLADSPFTTFAEFQGLGANNQIQLDGTGTGMFIIRSKGLLAPNQFLPIEFTVREGSPFVGAPETVQRGMLVDHDWYTRTIDFSYGFIGGDPDGVAGIGGGTAGGLLLIGDIGALVKNGWRAAGQSDKPVNKVEVALGALGVATTAAAVTGAVDGPISAIRSLIAASDGVQLGKILAGFLQRGLQDTAELTRLGNFTLKVMTSDIALQGAKQVLTSEALVDASIRTVDKLGDLGGAYLERIAKLSAGPGIKVAQDVTTLFGQLSDDTLNFFKTLNSSQLDDALDWLGTTLRLGKVDVAQLRKLLDNNQLYTAAYSRSLLLRDLSILSGSEGIGTLVNRLKSETLAGPIQGRLYELQTAAKLLHDNAGWKVTFISKYAKEVDPITGKRLASTDVDFIIDDGTDLIYYQAKSSATAFGDSIDDAIAKAQQWVHIVQKDAERNGVTNQVIRYVTPNPQAIAQELADELANLGVAIVDSPLFR
jgi:hypothetical protein